MENNIETMESFEKDIDQSLKRIYVGDILEGTIVGKIGTDVIVDINYHAEGIINKEELSDDPSFDIDRDINIGDKIKVKILKLENEDGTVVLSKKRGEKETAFETLEEIFSEEKIIKIKINEVVKGGVITYINGMRGFIPASLLSIDYVDDLNKFVGKELDAKIVELDQSSNKIILSPKSVELEKVEIQKKEKLNTLQNGEVVEGTVKNLTNFGAFVDIGGIQGLVRNQDLAWKRVKHPSEIVQVGDQVKVYIINVDRKNEKISLGLKDVNENPWRDVAEKYSVNNIYEGQITRLLDFGAFVRLEEGVEGLVHISELSDARITKPSDVVATGDIVKVKVLDIDKKNNKMSLSIKEAQNELDRNELEAYNEQDEATTSLKGLFGDILKKLEKDDN
ncbi:small subunit ribosomal protein S1 [Natranaerovirga pectinivora]|uniref:Small subunit ribosomal protein S1 n=1 Tax=Natranaerovirga pectinivora TaxID=682400 RepID=A0A4R3MQM1_9FIRM|nr:30S ribosomal protein S1 [Natranaerovirga pectinivora]TCT16823.1 small subunit ribosomal protein S1 [Natranaerovirga pectinivora]